MTQELPNCRQFEIKVMNLYHNIEATKDILKFRETLKVFNVAWIAARINNAFARGIEREFNKKQEDNMTTKENEEKMTTLQKAGYELHLEVFSKSDLVSCKAEDGDGNVIDSWNIGEMVDIGEYTAILQRHGGVVWAWGNERRRDEVHYYEGNNREPVVIDASLYHIWKKNGRRWV